MKNTTCMKLVSIVAALALACVALCSCGGAAGYKDGTYTGQSGVFEDTEGDGSANGYGVVTLTIKDGKISECDFKTYQPDGTLKDKNYGKTNNSNQGFYAKAQAAVAACDGYAKMLVDAGGLDGVDTISGATINHDEFFDAVDDALSQAQA